LAAVLLAMLALAPAAAAHPYLVASTPQAGVVASGAPKSVQLGFTEALVLKGCSITVRDQHGHVAHTGPLRAANGGSGMSVTSAKLPEGIYSVSWVALGDDGHTVAGKFQFGVPSADGQAPPGAGKLLATTSANGSEQAPTESFVSVAGRWIAAVAAFVMLGGALLLLRLRGRLEEPGLRPAAERRWLKLGRAGLLIALLATVVEAIERSRAPQGGFDFSLLTASTANLAVVVRLAVLALGGLALLRVRRPAGRRLLLGAIGALALMALAIDGHVATARSAPVLAAIVQMVHLLSAGAWVGGVVVLAACVAPVALSSGRPAAALASARAFTPIALPAAVLTIATGVIAAVREVGRWYFLRWSSYGHILIAKVALVAIVLGLGALTTLLARRALREPEPASGEDRPRGRGSRIGLVMRGEAFIGIAVVAAAATLAGTLQGRGQPLPSQRGNLLPGAGFADVALKGSIAQMTLAPARAGINRLVVAFSVPANSGSAPTAPPHSVSVALSCTCGGRPIGINAPLKPGSGGPGAWYADVGMPLNGAWSAQLKVDGTPAVGSSTFTLGESQSPGSTPVTVASVADLSGPDAIDCRSQEIGSLLSIELMNFVGGVGGRKIEQVLLDDGGDPALARKDALSLAARHPAAFLSPCGQGAEAAIRAVGDRVPTIVADPSVPITQGRDVFRFAPDPYSEGYAAGEYVGQIGLPAVPPTTPRRVAALVSSDPSSIERLRGLRAGLARFGIALRTFPAGGPGLTARLRALVPETSWMGIYLDGRFTPLTDALRELGKTLPNTVQPTAIVTSSRLASERFVIDSGILGSEGQIRSISDVDPTSNAAQTYVTLSPQVVGELPTLPGLGGFVAGQALAYGLIGGTSPTAIAARLRNPGVFSQAAVSPWSSRDPADGTLMFRVFLPVFLTDNLIPVGNGAPGEPVDGQFFANGDWEPGAPTVFTPLAINNMAGITPGAGGSSIGYLPSRGASQPRRVTPPLGSPTVVPSGSGSGARGGRKR
jgi:copper transport protein